MTTESAQVQGELIILNEAMMEMEVLSRRFHEAEAQWIETCDKYLAAMNEVRRVRDNKLRELKEAKHEDGNAAQ